jgi:hypothetical protein
MDAVRTMGKKVTMYAQLKKMTNDLALSMVQDCHTGSQKKPRFFSKSITRWALARAVPWKSEKTKVREYM